MLGALCHDLGKPADHAVRGRPHPLARARGGGAPADHGAARPLERAHAPRLRRARPGAGPRGAAPQARPALRRPRARLATGRSAGSPASASPTCSTASRRPTASAAAPARFEPVAMEWFRERVRALDVAVRPPEPLLKGRDVLALGVTPGPGGRPRRCGPSTSGSSTGRSRRSTRRGPRLVAFSGFRLESSEARLPVSGVTMVRALSRGTGVRVDVAIPSATNAGREERVEDPVQLRGISSEDHEQARRQAAKRRGGVGVSLGSRRGPKPTARASRRGRSSISPRSRSTTVGTVEDEGVHRLDLRQSVKKRIE